MRRLGAFAVAAVGIGLAVGGGNSDMWSALADAAIAAGALLLLFKLSRGGVATPVRLEIAEEERRDSVEFRRLIVALVGAAVLWEFGAILLADVILQAPDWVTSVAMATVIPVVIGLGMIVLRRRRG